MRVQKIGAHPIMVGRNTYLFQKVSESLYDPENGFKKRVLEFV